MRYLMITLLLTIGCASPEQQSATGIGTTKYEYSNDFNAYMQETFQKEVLGSKEYFIVPLGSCGECVDSALFKLANNKYNWIVILSGETEDSVRLEHISKLKEKYEFYLDSTSQINSYSVSIALPTLLKADDKSIIISKKEFHFGSWAEFQM